MKAILVIDLPNDLDISLDEIKTDITVLSKDFRKSTLFLKYKNIALKPMPQKKNKNLLNKNTTIKDFNSYCSYRDGWNDCINEIVGG